MIVKIKFWFFSYLFCVSLQVIAQDNPPLAGFDIKPSNSGPSYVTDIAKDAAGNIYVAGVFGGTMETYSLTSAGNNDIFFAKFNSTGSLLWIKRIGGTGDDQATTISFDQTGSTIFLGGMFNGTVDFDPNAGLATLTSGGGRDAFLGRYTTDGAYMWIGNVSGTADAQIRDIVCTPTTVYVTGLFYGTADFGFGSDFNSQTSSGVADAFIAGYFMSSGAINNLRIIGSAAGEDYGYSIATDASSNIYVTGVYNGTVNFGNTNLSSTGNMDMFCAKYTSTLSPVWAASSGVNATNDFGKAITVDGSGNVYITGSWYTGVWIQKFNSSGVTQWSTSLCQFGGGVGQGEGISVNTNGDVVIAGHFTSSTGFATICSGPYYISSQGDSDSFVAKYSGVDGSFKWVKTVLNSGPDAYNTITSDVANNVIVAGNGTTISNYSLQITKYFDDPPSQPTALTFSNVTTSGFTATYSPTFTQPINGQGGYIVVRKAGSPPAEYPTDGISPSSFFDFGGAEILGTSIVVAARYTGSSNSFTETLSPNTEYHYAVYAFNGDGNYLHTNPLRGSQFTLAIEPTAQPSNLTFNTFTQTSFNASFSAASGAPAGYLVTRKVGSAPTGTPLDGTAYTIGNPIGDGVVVSIGPSTTFSQTGLVAGTTYFYQVFSYSGSGQSINYKTTTPLSNSAITIPPNPVAVTPNPITSSGFTAIWNSSLSATSYRLDVSPDNFGTFVIGYNNKTVTGTSDPVTGLNPNTIYKYRVRAVNTSGTSGNSNEISQITVTAAPVAITAATPSQTGFTANWNAVAGAVGYKLDVSDNSGFSSFVTGFSNKDVAPTNSPVTGLSSGVTYYYRVRSYNSAGTSPNSNTISQITIPANPVAGSATLPEQTQFIANWNAVTGATGYRLDVSSDGFVSFVSGFNNKIATGIIETVTGLSPGVTYQYRVRTENTVS
ncbi:MAG: fibronectin type III domain-containing protein, partial [Cyclobacteriaceae bacterium]